MKDEAREARKHLKDRAWLTEKIDPTLTPIKDKNERASVEYWNNRVKTAGNHKSPFLDKPQKEIDAFTARHRGWVEPWVKGQRVLEIGCGYGRNMEMFREASFYVGVDCVKSLAAEARAKYREVFPELPSGGGVYEMDLRNEEFLGFNFDICVAIAVISSVEPYFHDLRRKIMEVLRPGGVILWLEEDYHRVDYK